jgi:RNA polymerase sigma-70 factor (ECF subfamily)
LVQSDEKLVSTCLAGSKDAFEVLVRRYERPIRAVALGVLGDFHRAEDAAQEAFIRAWEKLPGLRNRAAFGPWITKIAKRSAINIARRQPKITSGDPGLVQAIEKPDGRLETDKQILLAAVIKLRRQQRQLIMLRYFGRHSVKDIAKITGRSVGTITKQLSRSREKLKAIIERAGK